MTVTDSTFLDNSAESTTGQGGAIADDAGFEVTIVRSSFVGNQAVAQLNGASGGAIYTALEEFSIPPTTTDITASSFTDNTAMGWGQNTAGGTIADAQYVPSFPAIRSPSRVRPSWAIRPWGLRQRLPPCAGRHRCQPGEAELSITSSSFLDNQAIGISPPAAFGMPGGI